MPQALIDALPQPVLVVGRDERVALMNPPAAALLGGLGRHYITALRQPAILDAVEAVLAGGTARSVRYLGREAGRDTTWSVHVAGDGQGGAVLSFLDVTNVEQAGRMRRDFVANVSHELRSPLTAILGVLETLRGPARENPEATSRFLDLAGREAARMQSLLGDLLSLSRVEQDERLRPTEPVDLGPVVRTTLERVQGRAETAGVTLEATLPDGAVVVPGDAMQLGQVLTNLVENAIAHGRPGGTVRIALDPPEHHAILRGPGVRLAVTDDGPGIEAHHIARLTERFYRVDGHRSRASGGTGLGLAIVKHIVSRHRGRLRIDSVPGQGSTFSVLLPT